jgi:MSHA biogenesis protein MshP
MCPKTSSEFRVASHEPEHESSRFATGRPPPRRAQRGFSLVTAVFLITVLAVLGAFMVSVGGFQQKSSQLDIQGARAYQAARAGVEWGAYQSLRNGACAGSTTLTFPAGTTLAAFSTTVTCNRYTPTELNATVTMDQITATACNDVPPCPNAAPTVADYLERQITITVGQ